MTLKLIKSVEISHAPKSLLHSVIIAQQLIHFAQQLIILVQQLILIAQQLIHMAQQLICASVRIKLTQSS